MVEPTSTCVEVRVRYCECDPMNVAHHAVYPVWMEIARTELLRQQGVRYRDLEAMGTYFVVARLNLGFRRPALYDDVLQVHCEATRVGGVKVEHRYEIRRDNEVLTTAQTTLACVDASGRPCAVPETLGGQKRRGDG